MKMKKYLLTIMFAIMSLMLFAQETKKVAILETVDKDGSVSYAHKLMLRANLAKAITNTIGYEAYDRTDMDQIVSEQNFQRTGMVSEDQIKQIGIMTGASYVLIAEAARVDDENLFITAKIVNVESAKTERTENALMSINANEIQLGCESMAYKLLGVTPNKPIQEISREIKDETQSKQTIYNDVSNSTIIGQLKTFPDGTSGVIFYDSGDGHGLVVALHEFEERWAKKNRDVYTIVNEENCVKVIVSGAQNTDKIIAQLGDEAYAAVRCRQLGSDWYLPSSGELYYLLKIANQGKAENGPVSLALVRNGGKQIDGWYWSSSENDKDEAFNISDSGSCHSEEKTEEVKVRPVRAF